MNSADQTNSQSEKEARKSRRRTRITNGFPDSAGNSNGDSGSSIQSTEQSGETQISESFQRLDELQSKSSSKITGFRSRAEEQEILRRDADDVEQAKTNELMRERDAHCSNDDEIKSGWKECSTANNAESLFDLMNKQKARCEHFIKKLEDIRNELGSQLRQKEQEYVTTLKRNRLEIESLEQFIKREHLGLKEAFERELGLIETSFDEDRGKLVDRRREELDSLISERDKIETEKLEHQKQIIDEQRKQIEESESKGFHDRRALKETLESELRRLEIQLEENRAKHQFDADKLEFDVRVLTELSENESDVKKLKRRIMKYKEDLNREMERKERVKASGTKENESLEGDCERIEKQSSGMKEKFERFKFSDDEKYNAILELHREDLRQLELELKESKRFIFGAIGCSDASQEPNDASCISDLTVPDDIKPVIGETTKDDWDEVESLVTNYKNVLERRESLNVEVDSMERQNDNLEKELESKLTEKINDELVFPPSNLVLVGNYGVK